MRMLAFHILKSLSYTLRPLRHGFYIRVLQYAYELMGVKFSGSAKYIHHDVYIDCIGDITIGEGVVISTRAILLAHDYSHLVFQNLNKRYTNRECLSKIIIGKNVFVGAGAIILPGTNVGNNCIIGAGAVVKGHFPNNSVIAGNPARIIKQVEKDI